MTYEWITMPSDAILVDPAPQMTCWQVVKVALAMSFNAATQRRG